jgi:hypothetical protein
VGNLSHRNCFTWVYWWGGGKRWSKCCEPKNLTLAEPTELPDDAIELRGSLRAFDPRGAYLPRKKSARFGPATTRPPRSRKLRVGAGTHEAEEGVLPGIDDGADVARQRDHLAGACVTRMKFVLPM